MLNVFDKSLKADVIFFDQGGAVLQNRQKIAPEETVVVLRTKNNLQNSRRFNQVHLKLQCGVFLSVYSCFKIISLIFGVKIT